MLRKATQFGLVGMIDIIFDIHTKHTLLAFSSGQ